MKNYIELFLGFTIRKRRPFFKPYKKRYTISQSLYSNQVLIGEEGVEEYGSGTESGCKGTPSLSNNRPCIQRLKLSLSAYHQIIHLVNICNRKSERNSSVAVDTMHSSNVL